MSARAKPSFEDKLFEQMKASEALAALVAKHIPPRDISRVTRLLCEADKFMVAGILRRAVTAHGWPNAVTAKRK
jgi:hypothetical protein